MTTLKISDETFEEDVINKNNPVLVDFGQNGVDHANK